MDAPKHTDGTVNLSYRPLVGILFASLVVMGAALSPCTEASSFNYPPQGNTSCVGVLAYAVALGSAGAFFAIVGILGHRHLPPTVLQFLAYFSFAWWIAGAGIVRFFACLRPATDRRRRRLTRPSTIRATATLAATPRSRLATPLCARRAAPRFF